MGIYDRDYYRNDGPSFLASITSTAPVCKWLIMVNVAVFILQMLDLRGVFGPRGMFTQAFVLDTAAPWEVWRLLTHAFLHDPGSFFHIFWNMLFLWWFGSDLEQYYGSREFLAFYLASALAGGLLYLLAAVTRVMDGGVALGASGAVTAVMVLTALHWPHKTILIFFILPVPIWLVVLFQVGKDLWQFLGNIQTGVAVAVHLGGALFAFAYYQLQLRLLNLLPDFRAWRARRGRPQLRVYREEEPVVAAAPRPAPTDADEHLEAKVDAVLEKVARHGRQSLSEAEHQLLLRAGELYKKRRK